jgi:DNA polymerase III gamma/tau subunit
LKAENMAKEEKVEDNRDFDQKYRPTTLDKVIGNEKVVTRLKGIIKSGKYPKTLLFVGPSSAGKTTLARAFVADMMGVPSVPSASVMDYHESNAANQRKIDDIRDLLKVVKLKPKLAPRRVFFIDEAHQIGGDAAQTLLKPLEEPPPLTMFILGSMEPEKLLGAMKNRATQFVLEGYTKEEVIKFVKRIRKGEGMDYMTDEQCGVVAENSNGELRAAAFIMQGVSQYVAGLDKNPKKIKDSDIAEALSSMESIDDAVAIKYLLAIYANKPKAMQKALLDISDPFRVLQKVVTLNNWLLNKEALGVESHKAVWYSKQNQELLDGIKEFAKLKDKKRIQAFASVNEHMVDMKMRAAGFLVPETALMSVMAFRAMASVKPYLEKEEK